MPVYTWVGIDQQGKKIYGTDQAYNRYHLKVKLAKQQIFLLTIKFNFSSLATLTSPLKAKHITYFIEQLSILINANVSIIKALTIISHDATNPALTKLIVNCKSSIVAGQSLYQTWQQYPQYFTQFMCSIVNAGEQSGTLDSMLDELTTYLKKAEQQKRKIIKTLLYPLTILSITVVTTMILLIIVIPQFTVMFNNLGATLPSYTQGIIKLSTFLQKTWPIILMAIITISSGIKISYRQLAAVRRIIDRLVLKLPLIQHLVAYTLLARIAKTLGLTLKAGLSLLRAINIAATMVTNDPYREALQQTAKAIASGKAFYQALAEQQLVPSNVIQLIALGEETGSLDLMLEKIAAIYNDKLNHMSDNLNQLLEPIIMLILGGLVGGLIIGMYLPIFRLGMVI